MSRAARPAQAVEGIGNVRYKIPRPVDLPAGRTADLLYLDLAVAPEVQALYQPGRSGGVLLAVRLTADQALAPGLVSVRDANGFVGDAPFTGFAVGQSRLLPYAAATGAVVTQDRSETDRRITLAASGGSLRMTVRTRITTTYRATLPDGVDMFVVEHPRHGGSVLETSGAIEENADLLRVSVPVADGKTTVRIAEEETTREDWSVMREAVASVLAIVTQGNAAISDADHAILDRAAAAAARIDAAEVALTDAQARYDALLTDQGRLRDNLGAVQSEDLRRRYEAKLGEAEDTIAALLDAMDKARTDMREGEQDLDHIIGEFV